MQPIRVLIVETERPIRSQEIVRFCPRSIRELSLVGIQLGISKREVSEKIKSVQSGYRDLAFGIKDVQYKVLSSGNILSSNFLQKEFFYSLFL